MTQHQRHVVLANLLVVVGRVLPHVLRVRRAVITNKSGVRRLVAHLALIVLILTIAPRAAVKCKLRLQREPLQRVQLQIGTAEEAAALDVALIGTVLVEQRRAVGRIPRVRGGVDRAVVQVGMRDRRHLLSLVERTTGTLVVASVGVRQAGAHLHHLINLVVQVHAARVAVKLIALHQALVVHGSKRDGEVGLVRTAMHRHLIVLRHTVVEHHVEPVGVRLVVVNVERRRHVLKVERQHVGRRGCIGERPAIGSGVLVVLLVKQALHLLVAVHRLHDARHAVERQVAVEVHRRTACLTTLRRDEDDAVGTLRTVDGRRGCVLQNVHRLDVAGRNIQRRAILHTVDNHQRVVVGQKRTVTTHLHAHTGTGLTTAAQLQVNARNLGLHGRQGVGTSNLRQVVGFHARNSTRQVLLLQCAVTHDNHFVQSQSVLLKCDVKTLLASYRELLLLVANVRNTKNGILGNLLNGEVAVVVGNTANAGAIDNHAHANHRLPE